MIKRIYPAILAMTLLLSACAPSGVGAQPSERRQIVASIFPQYEFARAVFGGLADVTLLLPPGAESHSFDPTQADIMAVAGCDLFIYTGSEGEPWAERILKGISAPSLDLSQGIDLLTEEEEEAASEAISGRHDEDGQDHHGHGHTYDPHIWTSPLNAQMMVRAIADKAAGLDPPHADIYHQNAEDYCAELQKLDDRLRETVSRAVRRELMFGGRFAFGYLTYEYGLAWTAAYDSCSHESEPTIATVVEMIDEIREEGIPVIYYEELSRPAIALLISGETGAKMRLLHGCANLSTDELMRGETFLSIMNRNIDYIEEGIC